MAQVAAEPVTTIRVDFNVRARGGRVRTSLEKAGIVSVGDHVLAVDPDEHLAADAVVADVDATRGLVFLDVDWTSFTDSPPTPAPPISITAGIVVSITGNRFVSGAVSIARDSESETFA